MPASCVPHAPEAQGSQQLCVCMCMCVCVSVCMCMCMCMCIHFHVTGLLACRT